MPSAAVLVLAVRHPIGQWWMSWRWGGNTAPPQTESETDRCTATGRPDLRPPSNLAPLRLPLSSRSAWFDPLRPPAAHGPLPRHHTLTQLRRSREMSDELRCCVRTRVGGCSRCMACALATSISQRFRHSGTEHSELSGDLGHGYDYIIHAAPRARPACCRRALGGRWWNSPPYRSCSAVIQPPGTTVGGSRPPDRA